MIKKHLAALVACAVLGGCGENQDAPKSQSAPPSTAASKETPEQCYARKYEAERAAREKELREAGEKGPFYEQDLVPQGIRVTMQEDCGVKD